MRDLDVRDLEGRLGRLVASISIGLSAAVLIAAMLPGHSGFAGPAAFALPVLIAVGAVALAIGVNAGWHAARHRRRRVRLPRARVRPVSSRVARPRR